jgi:CheY-like chemotaxis protein
VAHILVIDDDPKIRSLLARILTSNGHRVREAVDGGVGIKLYLQAAPELVITDIVMPNREGIETIRLLREWDPALPILAISGNGREGYLRFAVQFGATAALQKPFDAEQLLSAVDKLLAEPVPH